MKNPNVGTCEHQRFFSIEFLLSKWLKLLKDAFPAPCLGVLPRGHLGKSQFPPRVPFGFPIYQICVLFPTQPLGTESSVLKRHYQPPLEAKNPKLLLMH